MLLSSPFPLMDVPLFYLERSAIPTLAQMQSIPWISPRCPHISMSAGVVMKSARASCCPCSGEPVSSWVMAASSDTLFLELQNTHRDNGAQVGHTYSRHTCPHIPIILNKQADRGHVHCGISDSVDVVREITTVVLNQTRHVGHCFFQFSRCC